MKRLEGPTPLSVLKGRFDAKVLPEPNSGCWLWTGALQNDRYGHFRIGGRYASQNIIAHRFSYEFHCGPIPDGYTIDHLCKVTCCVNPDHLEPVTQYENLRRSSAWYPETYARRRRATHCRRGHELTPENTYQGKNRGRCRICGRARDNERYRRLKN